MLKDKILKLKEQGYIQSEIARILNCSTGTVSYHVNPQTKEKALQRKRKTSKPKELHFLLEKEITVEQKSVCWKHAEALCLSKLIELGYEVFTPFTGGGEIDLLAYKYGIFYKVQVKSVSPTNKSFIDIYATRSSINYKSSKNVPYENIDFFMVYDGTNIYKIMRNEINASFTLRYKIPKNNQVKNVKMASEYVMIE